MSAAQMSLSVLRGGGASGPPTATRGRPGPSLLSAGHRLRQIDRGRIRSELARPCIENELKDFIAAQRGNVNEPIVRIDADRMGVATHGDHLQWLG
jgi:hypothetical protein